MRRVYPKGYMRHRMKIEVKGYRTQNKGLVEEIKDLAEWSARKYMRSDLVNKIRLEVRLIKNLNEKEGIFGSCDWAGDVSKRPKEFEIELDGSADHMDIMSTLTHEMIHLKQFAKGELENLVSGLTRYKNKKYSMFDEAKDPPWEKEAYRNQFKNYAQFLMEKEGG